MRIRCLHGFFLFDEDRSGELSDFASLIDFDLVPYGPHGYTFDFLKNAPKHAIAGNTYLGANATTTFEGKPWEIMRENGLIYNFNKGLVEPIESVTKLVEITRAQNYYLSQGLILPGSLTVEGQRVTDYSARFSLDSQVFKYSEVVFE